MVSKIKTLSKQSFKRLRFLIEKAELGKYQIVNRVISVVLCREKRGVRASSERPWDAPWHELNLSNHSAWKRTLRQRLENWKQSLSKHVEDTPSVIVRYNYYKKDAPKGNLRDAACMFPVFSNFFPPYGPCESLQSACQHSWYISSFLYAACSPESIFIP